MFSAADRICNLLAEANEVLETIDSTCDEEEEALARVDALLSLALREAERLTRDRVAIGV